jgi:Tfp pilus assembly protein PilO
MNKDRLWVIGAVAAIAIVVVLGYVLGVSPLLDTTSAANAQSASLTASNTASLTKLSTLEKEYKEIDSVRSDLAGLRKSIPSDGDLPAFLSEINDLCKAYHVTLTSVSLDSAVAYVPPVTAAPAATTDGSTATPTPTPTPTAAPTAATPAAEAPAASGIVVTPVSLNVTGSLDNVLKFTKSLQTSGRLMLVSTFSVTPGSGDAGTSKKSGIAAVLSGSIFSLAGASDDVPTNTTTPTPEPTETETPTPTSTSSGAPGSSSTPTATP